MATVAFIFAGCTLPKRLKNADNLVEDNYGKGPERLETEADAAGLLTYFTKHYRGAYKEHRTPGHGATRAYLLHKGGPKGIDFRDLVERPRLVWDWSPGVSLAERRAIYEECLEARKRVKRPMARLARLLWKPPDDLPWEHQPVPGTQCWDPADEQAAMQDLAELLGGEVLQVLTERGKVIFRRSVAEAPSQGVEVHTLPVRLALTGEALDAAVSAVLDFLADSPLEPDPELLRLGLSAEGDHPELFEAFGVPGARPTKGEVDPWTAFRQLVGPRMAGEPGPDELRKALNKVIRDLGMDSLARRPPKTIEERAWELNGVLGNLLEDDEDALPAALRAIMERAEDWVDATHEGALRPGDVNQEDNQPAAATLGGLLAWLTPAERRDPEFLFWLAYDMEQNNSHEWALEVRRLAVDPAAPMTALVFEDAHADAVRKKLGIVGGPLPGRDGRQVAVVVELPSNRKKKSAHAIWAAQARRKATMGLLSLSATGEVEATVKDEAVDLDDLPLPWAGDIDADALAQAAKELDPYGVVTALGFPAP